MRRYSERTALGRKRGRYSFTTLILCLNVIVFFISSVIFLVLGISGDEARVSRFVSFVSLNPELVINGHIWTILTSMFVHFSFGHLLVNMISLFFVGSFVERIIGKKRYLWFYLISGVVAGLFFVGFAYIGTFFPNGRSLFGGIDDYGVGASGAIFGLGGLLAVLLPRLRVLVFFIIPMPMWAAMVVLLFGMWILSAFGGLPVGNTAHLGGLIVGLIYGIYLRAKYARKIAFLNRMFR